MRNYRVTIIRKWKDREKKYCIPIQGEDMEDVKKYIEEEFIPEMAKGRTSLCIHHSGAEYSIEKIVLSKQY